VVVLIRPEDMAVAAVLPKDRPPGDAASALAGTIRDISYHGDTFRLDVDAGGDAVKVKVARAQGACMAPGERVLLTWGPDAARILPVADRGAAAGDAP